MLEEIRERKKEKPRKNYEPSIPTPEIKAPKIDDLLSEIDELLRKKLPERYNPCKC